ncbi:toll/interleukin-1 receptor domain-containing protein [Candidatus Poribacteria bacterium]|nr:toll/interleukin-1 receptor domain-containing protein [Candidatus Poribacteria bacterium]
MIPNEVFLSHSSLDRDFVTNLANVLGSLTDDFVLRLRHHGVPVWYSQTNIMGAQQWHDEIGAALRRCDWFLLVLSRNSVASMWVKRELIFALQQNRFENRIVPLLYQDCDFESLSWVLPTLIQILYISSCQKKQVQRARKSLKVLL